MTKVEEREMERLRTPGQAQARQERQVNLLVSVAGKVAVQKTGIAISDILSALCTKKGQTRSATNCFSTSAKIIIRGDPHVSKKQTKQHPDMIAKKNRRKLSAGSPNAEKRR